MVKKHSKKAAGTDFDVIVVGSGITGGWAAKELTERGLRVLVLERGRNLQHGSGYVTEHLPPWKFPERGLVPRKLYADDYPVQSQYYLFDETNRHFWNHDGENPYLYEKGDFKWHRAGVVGGRSLLWGRQVYRWSERDFEANRRDGHGVDWPLRYRDLESWYDHVERFIGVSGRKEGWPELPDGIFQLPMPYTPPEEQLKDSIERNFPGRHLTIGRVAVLTEPLPGRAACHYCGPCERGCATGSYFSSLSSTLPAATATGKLTLLPDMVVSQLLYDSERQAVSAVRTVNTNTLEQAEFTARCVFLCASTVGTAQILLNSRSESFPNGLANRSGAVGHYLMDHTSRMGAFAVMPGNLDRYVYGRRPNGIYIPRFRNLQDDEELSFVRGYGFQGITYRMNWRTMMNAIPGFGTQYKQALRAPGPWVAILTAYGECLPRRSNRMELVAAKPDRYGIPQVKFYFSHGANEQQMREDAVAEAVSMLRSAGGQNISPFMQPLAGGDSVHEMGTARMGNNPADSVLNRWNQAHDVNNLFITDGACMTSSSCVNPSLTYMALTARAANYAADLLLDGRL